MHNTYASLACDTNIRFLGSRLRGKWRGPGLEYARYVYMRTSFTCDKNALYCDMQIQNF